MDNSGGKKLPDAELIRNLHAGTAMDESIKVIYRDCFDSLSAYILHNNGSLQDAEDMFQEVVVTFIRLVQQEKFRGESSVKTFIYSLNRYAWLNELKRRGRALAREEKFESGKEKIEDTSQHIVNREARKQLMQMVEKLGDSCKKILLLFYYENRSMKEIQETTHYENEQVVRNKKSKCLKQLAQLINEAPHLKDNFKNSLHG